MTVIMDTKNTKRNHTKILFWNANSIRNKKHELLHLMQSQKIPIALISETHLRLDEKFSTRNFISYRYDRQNRGGGVAVIIHKSIKHNKIQLPQLNRLEAVGIQITVNRKKLNIIAGYNPPGDLATVDSETILSPRTILAGDFNAKHTDWGSRANNKAGRKLSDLQNRSNFQIIGPDRPTYILNQANRQPDILDIAMAKDISSPVRIEVMNELNSDHLPVILHLNEPIELAEQRQH
jgi:Exonuclease III